MNSRVAPIEARDPRGGKGTFKAALKVVGRRLHKGAIKRIDHAAPPVCASIIGILGKWLLKWPEQKESIIGQTRDFLFQDNRHVFDNCILWSILVAALRETENVETADILSEIIIETRPIIAFLCLSELNKPSDVLICIRIEKCSDPSHATPDGTIPFNLAAKMGKHRIISIMVSSIGPELQDADGNQKDTEITLLKLAQARDPASTEAALPLALKATKTPIETIKELLKVTDITTGDKSFDTAIENGWDKVVEAFFASEMKVPSNTDLIMKALGTLKKEVEVHGAQNLICSGPGSRLKLVKDLVNRFTTPHALDERIVDKLIMEELIEVWEVWRQKSKGKLAEKVQPWVLHMAVMYGKVGFVRMFIEDFPDMLSREEVVPCYSSFNGGRVARNTAKYPLWYNNHSWNEGSDKEDTQKPSLPDPERKSRILIRDLIITKMIHELDMDKLPDILHKSNEPFDDMCFDISRFNSAAYRISDIVDSLIRHDRNSKRGMHRFEQTLKYVAFPPLDTMIPDREVYLENMHLKKCHSEVFRILDWLSTKNVTKIIKLTVPDRLVNPHDESKMAAYVRKFRIEVLDWKVLDLSISIFQTANFPEQAEIRELYLYSSGKRAAIDHWFCEENGVPSLSKLTKLYVHVIRETCTVGQVGPLLSYIRVKNKGLGNEPNQRTFRMPDPVEVAWYPSPSVADLSKIACRLSPPLANWLTELGGYVEWTGAQERLSQNPTKIAILDNGVLSILPVSNQTEVGTSARRDRARTGPDGGDGSRVDITPTGEAPAQQNEYEDEEYSLWSRIKAGKSFVDGSPNFSPWQFPSDPHGTQMANLICALDPFSEIFVARVAEDAFGINAKSVVKAIEWAMDENVDIISMSFVLGEDPDGAVEKKIKEAGKAGIVMTCSTHDEGSRILNAYPASYKKQCSALLVLAACDEYGKVLRDIETNSYSYALCGKNVPAGVVPFIKSQEKISGSSVATALAAGLCSLILTCARLADPGRNFDTNVNITGNVKLLPESSRIRIVTKHLDRMVSDSDIHYVLLERFGQIASPSVGAGIKYDRLDESGNARPPSVREVLQEHFGMK